MYFTNSFSCDFTKSKVKFHIREPNISVAVTLSTSILRPYGRSFKQNTHIDGPGDPQLFLFCDALGFTSAGMKTDTVESGKSVPTSQRKLLSAVEYFTMNVGYNHIPPKFLFLCTRLHGVIPRIPEYLQQ
jgi:hypothetical protein